MEEIAEKEAPFEFQVFKKAFTEEGAISRLANELEPWMVGSIHGDQGLGEFYQAVLDFYRDTNIDPVDTIAFKSWLEAETDVYDVLGGSGGVDFFINSILEVETTDTDAVIKVIKHRARKRQQLNLTIKLQNILEKKGHKSEDEIEQIREFSERIRDLETSLEYDPLERVTTATDISDRAGDIMSIPDFLPTPFPSYNKALGYTEDAGYFRGACHAVVAMSGKGKSTFTKCLCNYWADQGYRVLFINFEEAQAHWERILMTQIIGENVYKYAEVWTDEEREERLALFRERLDQWGDKFMVRHDPDTSYFEDLEIWLHDIVGHAEHRPDVVVIDTLQSLVTRGSGPRWGEFEAMMIKLERLARDMDAVFVLTAQQNAEQMKEKREVVQQTDVGGGITITQKSSVVTFLAEKNAMGAEEFDDHIMELQITKNRITGDTGSYDPPVVVYNDETKSYEEFKVADAANYQAAALIADDVFGDFNI